MTTPSTPGSLAGHVHERKHERTPMQRLYLEWTESRDQEAFDEWLVQRIIDLEAENARLKTTNWIAVAYQEMDRADALEARLEAAERVVVLARLYATAPKSRLKDALADYDAALTRPVTAAEQEAGE